MFGRAIIGYYKGVCETATFLSLQCSCDTRHDAVFVFPPVHFHAYPKIYKGNTTVHGTIHPTLRPVI